MNYPDQPEGLSKQAELRRRVVINKVNDFFDEVGEEKDHCIETEEGGINYIIVTSKSGNVCKVGYTTQ